MMNEVSTTDIPIASYLEAIGHPIIDRRFDGKICTFVFSPEAREVIENWLITNDNQIRLIKEYQRHKDDIHKYLKQEQEKTRRDYGTWR